MPSYIDLRPGQRVSVLRDGGALSQGFLSVIRQVSPETVRLDMPRRGTETLAVTRGDDVMLMLELHGRLFTCLSRVQQVDTAPIEVLYVDRPSAVEQSERREFFRLALTIRPRYAAALTADGEERTRLDAAIRDISGGGVQLTTRQYVAPGERVRLMFDLAGDPVEADVRVITTDELAATGPRPTYRVNAHFEDLPRAVQDRVVRFVFQQQVQFMRKGVR